MASSFDTIIDDSIIRHALGSAQKQFPYALSVAVNSCIFASRKRVAVDLPHAFRVRTQFVPRGLHVTMATKSRPEAYLGFLGTRWFMESQVTGDPSREKPSGKNIWQPVEGGPKAPRPNINEKIIPSRRPNVAQPPGFKHKVNKHGDRVKSDVNKIDYIFFKNAKGMYPGIYYRDDEDSSARGKLHAAYWLRKSQPVKARYPMNLRVEEVVKRTFPAAAIDAVERALKPKGSKPAPWKF